MRLFSSGPFIAPLHPACSGRGSALVAAVLTIGVALTLPAYAQAQGEGDSSEEDQAAQHFTKGRRLYSAGKYKEAIASLLKAFALRPAPPILLNIARTYEKLDDKPKALEFYRKFLLKARMQDPNRASVETMVKKLEAETGVQAAGPDASAETPTVMSGAEPAETEPPAPTRREQLIHTPVDSAKVRQEITIQAELPPEVTVDKVWVFFRKQGEAKFRQLEMAAQGDAYIVKIPPKYVTSTSLQYYLEAHAAGHKRPVAIAGSRITPHIVVVEGGRVPTATPVDIRSPYRTWFWVSAAGTVALLGASVTVGLLAADRSSAVEEIAYRSPLEAFDKRGRDWESQGKSFATISGVLLGVGIAAAGATGYLWYLDRKDIERKRRELAQGAGQTVRFSAAPWASPDSGGFVGRIDF